MSKLTHILSYKRVQVYLHWTVLVLGTILLLYAIRHPAETLTGLFCYLGMFFIHELGHTVAAHRRHLHVFEIRIYPIFAITEYEQPGTAFDQSIVAWGGVLAQFVVAVPIIAYLSVFGYTSFEPLNAAIAILGPLSFVIACLNLLPAPPLDGETAWRIVPLWFHRMRFRREMRNPKLPRLFEDQPRNNPRSRNESKLFEFPGSNRRG